MGLNNSEIQLDKAKSLNAEAGISHMVDYLACSFMDMSAVTDGAFDRAYAIESTCHAPDKAGAFAEIYRVLKPGALFWGQEMCMTDEFDPGDSHHRAIKRELMHGIALKDIATTGEVNRALEAAGFQVIEGKDRAVELEAPTTPWYQPMETQRGTLGNALRRTPRGRKFLVGASRLAETLRVFPKGSTDVIELMDRTANAYIAGGRTGIFTPLYCFLARKPPLALRRFHTVAAQSANESLVYVYVGASGARPSLALPPYNFSSCRRSATRNFNFLLGFDDGSGLNLSL